MTRRRRDILRAAALAAAAAAVVLPDRVGLDRRFPFVDTVAWRPQAAAAALLAGAALATTRRGSRPTAAGLAAVGLCGLATVAGRALGRPSGGPGDLTVLTVNVLRGRADTGALATLIEREHPDFVVLPEAGADFRDKLMALVEVLGYRSWTSTGTGVDDTRGVTLLAAPRAGGVTVRAGRAMRLRHLDATGGLLGSRTLHAVHTTAPLLPRGVPAWRRDLRVIGQWCRAPVAPVVVGDLNATLDHSVLRDALGGCRSAATGTGRGLVGTFPAALPRLLGIQIDHVLVPAGTTTTRFEVVDVAGSDHRGLLVTLRLPPHP